MKKLTVCFGLILLFVAHFFFYSSTVLAQYTPQYFQKSGLANEAETLCEPLNLLCNPTKNTASCTHELANSYFLEDGGEELEMREGAGLDQGTSSKAIHCGITKGTPLVLNETSTYCLGTNACYWPGWIREVRMNYSPFTMRDNLQVPFAEQMARQWAGIMDTEHMTPEEYDNLIAAANQPLGGVGQSGGDENKKRDKIDAKNEIDQRTGALQKLLSQDDQDILKCNFAKWTAQRRVAGLPTLYNGYKPDGQVMIQLLATACRNEVCPSGMQDRGKCLSDYDTGKYIASGPNGSYAPGPAWNKMNIIPNDKTTGTLYFDVYDDTQYLLSSLYPELMKLGLAANEAFRIFTPLSKQKEFYALPYYDNLDGNPLDHLSQAKDPIWNTNVGYMSKKNSSTDDSANNIVFDTSSKDEKKEQWVVSANQTEITKKRTGFIRAFEEKIKFLGFERFKKALSSSLEKTLQKTGVNAFWEEKGDKLNDILLIASQKSKSSSLLSFIGSVLGKSTPGKRRCIEGQCCVTQEGPADCGKACQNTRKGPSFTTVWPRTYPANHVILGIDWDEKGPEDIPMVRYFYLDGMGSKIGSSPFCSDIYQISQKRVVDVYNKVPFLASVWVQTTDPVYGFMANIKPFGATGAGIKEEGIGCTLNQDNVLDKDGKYLIQNAHMVMNYDFGVPSGLGNTTDTDHAMDIEVDLDYGNSNNLNKGGKPYQGKITYYRLAGVCNANKWWSEKVLNPLLRTIGQTGPSAVAKTDGKRTFPLNLMACQKYGYDNDNKPIEKDAYYSWDFCKKLDEPSCCGDLRTSVEKVETLEEKQEKSHSACSWPDRGWCQSCPDGTASKAGGNCGWLFTNYGYLGTDVLKQQEQYKNVTPTIKP